ncbi:MAG TPA: hypothetical protein PKW35_14020, partial [Nannocystaceae bacterium]|nr:hypothetical protein [Nannocystaceae bacterium]
MTMTPESKKALSSVIRGLRERLLRDLHDSVESEYRLSVPRGQDAGLAVAGRRRRKRLEDWLEEQVRALGSGASGGSAKGRKGKARGGAGAAGAAEASWGRRARGL